MKLTRKVIAPLVSLVLSLTITTLILWKVGYPPLDVGKVFVVGSFGNMRNFAEMLIKSTPMLVAALGVSLAFTAGLLNIGVEGQIYVGGLAAAYVGFAVKLPPVVHVAVCLLVGAAVGGALALGPAWLKVRRGVNEVITTLLTYYIATLVVHYLVVNPLRAPGFTPATPMIHATAKLPILIENTRLHLGVLLGPIIALALWFMIYRTIWGYRLRSFGENPLASAYGGISPSKTVYAAMFGSGALAGIAGAIQVLGLDHRFFDSFAPGLGFDSIAVALLGMSHPLGVMVSAVLFGVLRIGVLEMTVEFGTPKALALLVEGMAVLFLAFERLYRRWFIKEGGMRP